MSFKAFDWLLNSNQPSVRYYALTDLLDPPTHDDEVREACSLLSVKGWGHEMLKEQMADGHWLLHEESLYRPKYLSTHWRAIVLGDLGFTSDHDGIRRIAQLYFREWLSDTDKFAETAEVCVGGQARKNPH